MTDAPARPVRPRGPREVTVVRPAPHREWWERLACAVLLQAVADAQNDSATRTAREDARRFLAGGWRLEAWCNAASLPVGIVRRWAGARYLHPER